MDLTWLTSATSSTTFVMVVTTLLVAVAYHTFKSSGLPPGPTGVPLLGFWPFIDYNAIHLQFEKLQKKYGDVFSFTCTGTLYIQLGTWKAVRESIFAKSDCFSKRSDNFNYMNDIFGGGVVTANGEDWKANRRFLLQSIKERISLAAKDSHSGSLNDSVHSIVEELRKKSGEAIDVVELLFDRCNANIRLMLFGENGISKENITKINKLYEPLANCFVPPNLLVTGNFGRYLIFPYFTPGYKEAKANAQKISKILHQIIDEHKSTFDEDHIRDIIDEYIKERIVRSRNGDPTAKYFTDECLASSLMQVIGDGVLAVCLFVGLLIGTILEHPEEQDKIYRELVEVVGKDRQPTLEDKSRLSYTNAFIQEALRVSPFLALLPNVECTRETTLRGYRIPKGSVLAVNSYNMHHDPEVYHEPFKFNPSRFIAAEGKRKAEPIASFGVGKRSCIGENFVLSQNFLFLTTLIKNFHISNPPDVKNNDGKFRIVLQYRN